MFNFLFVLLIAGQPFNDGIHIGQWAPEMPAYNLEHQRLEIAVVDRFGVIAGYKPAKYGYITEGGRIVPQQPPVGDEGVWPWPQTRTQVGRGN